MIANCLGINEAGHLEISGCDTVPIYASKAFSCKEIYRIVLSEGLDVEVVSGGELYTALQAGVPGSQIHFQGNNKSAGELTMAVENGVGDIVVDNLYELERLNAIAGEHSMVAPISFRIKPGIDAHTHEFIPHRLSDFGEGAFCPRGGGDAPVLRQGAGRAGHGL